MTEPAVAPATTVPPPAAPTPAPESWREILGPDLKDNPNLSKYDDVPALAKAHVEAQKLIGAKGIIPPKEGASEEEMATFYASLGRPETVDGYEIADFRPPEVLADFWESQGVAQMAEAMHKRGLTKAQAQGLLSDFAEHQAATLGETIASIKTGKSQATEALKGKWGLAYEAKLDLARRTLGEAAAAVGLSREDLASRFLGNGGMVGNDPVLTEIFALIGEGSSELAFLGGAKGSRATLTPAEADAEIAKLEAHPAFADARHPEHKAMMEKRTALYQQKYPGEAAA